MPDLKDLNSFYENDLEIIGVNIKRTEENGSHCGLLYKTSGGENKFLHLAFHSLLLNETISEVQDPCYRWVTLNVDEYLVPSIAMWCEMVCEKVLGGFSIPYSLFFKSSTFTDEGVLQLGNNEHGLSCSTFVLALLEKAGVQLIDLNDWVEREEDKIAHAKLIEMLRNSKPKLGISNNHIENVEKEVGCLRYRPHEIAAAAIVDVRPAKFQETSVMGQLIFDKLPI